MLKNTLLIFSLLATQILYKSNDPIFFRVVIIISINFNIRKGFYLIFDKIVYHVYFKTFQLIVFFYFLHIVRIIFLYSFMYSFFFCLPSSDIPFSLFFYFLLFPSDILCYQFLKYSLFYYFFLQTMLCINR